jgi:hypothetical protein
LRDISETLVAHLAEAPIWPAHGDGRGDVRERAAQP